MSNIAAKITGGVFTGGLPDVGANNLGATLASGQFKITDYTQTALGTDNYGWVCIPHSTGGRKVVLKTNAATHLFDDDSAATSDITGEEFGTTAGTAHTVDREFHVYAVNGDNTDAGLLFAISPRGDATTTPATANIGYHGTPMSTPSDAGFFFLTSTDVTATHNAKPCARIGSIMMTKTASDDWTVTALNTFTGITQLLPHAFTLDPKATHNLSFVRATTTNAGDSIKITSATGTALSATNAGYINMPSTVTAGLTQTFRVVADVTILLTGAHWGIDTTGDIAGALLRVLAINDSGLLKWGVAYLGGRNRLLTTDTNATQASVNLPEEVLCNVAVAGSDNTCREIGYVRANFDDTGGAAENLWAIQSGVDDVAFGESADDIWQPWNPTLTGWSPLPTITSARWCQNKRTIKFNTDIGTAAASGTTATLTGPAKSRHIQMGSANDIIDNSANGGSGGAWNSRADSQTIDLYRTISRTDSWTAANNRRSCPFGEYEVGPVASFL